MSCMCPRGSVAQNSLAVQTSAGLGLGTGRGDRGVLWKVSVCGEVRLWQSPASPSLQVAILCQFLREVDYKTAFKALQEQNR